jgi:cbb3-type cytochrome oxidase subunit 1
VGAWGFGLLDELWPELRRSETWRRPLLADLHLVLTLGGAWTMALALFAAGWMQSALAREMAPWSAITEASTGFWMVRVVAGSAVVAGQVLLLINLIATRDRSLPKLREPREEFIEEPEVIEGLSEGMLR